MAVYFTIFFVTKFIVMIKRVLAIPKYETYRKIREITEKIGRKISELAREAVEEYFEEMKEVCRFVSVV